MTTTEIKKFGQLTEKAFLAGRKAYGDKVTDCPYASVDLAKAWQDGYTAAETEAANTPTVPTEDGIYPGIPDTVYHADHSSLSSSGARTLLKPGGPALFAHARSQPPSTTDAFDLGHAVHTQILGVGGEFVDVGFDAWTTKAAKEARDAEREAGRIPLRSSDFRRVMAMSEAVLAHPLAGLLFTDGDPELSVYTHDAETGIRLRTRPDWLPKIEAGPPMIVDFKTAASAAPDEFARSTAKYGYHFQAAWYIDQLAAAGIGDAQFLFVVADKNPPHLVSVFELAPEAIALGREQTRKAIDRYANCLETGRWPGIAEVIHRINLPTWAYTTTGDTE